MAWHLCQRWHNEGLPCPFHVIEPGGEEREKGDKDPPTVPDKVIPLQEENFGEAIEANVAKVEAPATKKAVAAVSQAVQLPNRVLCSCIENRHVVGVMRSVVITVSQQRAMILAAPQPPPVGPPTEARPNIVSSPSVGTNTIGANPRPQNADDFLRGLIEEDVVQALSVVARQNAGPAGVSANPAWADEWQETGMNGEEMVRAVAGTAIEGALPQIKQIVSRIQSIKGNPIKPVNTQPGSANSSVRMIRSIVGSGGWKGGGSGKAFKAPSFRGNFVAPYKLSPGNGHMVFPEGDPSF